MKRLFNTLLYL